MFAKSFEANNSTALDQWDTLKLFIKYSHIRIKGDIDLN